LGRIPSNIIEEIFDTARIEEVIGEFISLKKAGSNFKGLSPFVNEKTPSFMVSPAKQIFKDFSSGKGGNVVSFLMDHEQFTYPEALKWLAKKYNIEYEEEEQSEEQKKVANERESLYLVNEFAKKYFEDILHKNTEGRNIGLSYFKERGFSEETMTKFGLGYSLAEKDALSAKAQKEGYQLEYLEKTGLSINKNNYVFDRFAGRVIFPIQSMSGRVLGFGGRILRSDVKAAKYLNSPESPIYHKSKILYGLYQAKAEISKQDHCYLVEGYTDVVSLYQAGIKNVVASSGTALTKEQINLVKRLTPNLTILYDGDAAGIKASFRGIDLILAEGMNVRVILFPDGEDPDSFAKSKSKDELHDFLEQNRQDFVSFKTDILTQETDNDPIKKASIIKEVVMSIAQIPDPISRDIYIKQCSGIMDIDEQVLASELQIMLGKAEREESKKSASKKLEVVKSPEQEKEVVSAAANSMHYEQEKTLIWLMLNYGGEIVEKAEDEDEEDVSVAQVIIEDLIEDGLDFVNPQFQFIFKEYIDSYNEGKLVFAEYFARMEDQLITSIVSDLLTEKYSLANWERREVYLRPKTDAIPRYTNEAILRFKTVKVDDLIQGRMEGLRGNITAEEKDGIMREIKKYSQFKRDLNAELNRIL
jgi:DNA primase